jgi:hypothetical protein
MKADMYLEVSGSVGKIPRTGLVDVPHWDSHSDPSAARRCACGAKVHAAVPVETTPSAAFQFFPTCNESQVVTKHVAILHTPGETDLGIRRARRESNTLRVAVSSELQAKSKGKWRHTTLGGCCIESPASGQKGRG